MHGAEGAAMPGLLGERTAAEHLERIAVAARDAGTTVTVDAEDHTSTDATLRIATALREHPDDIPQLAAAILRRLASRTGIAAPQISAAARSTLERYSFPGNVRELENILERAVALSVSGVIEVGDLQLRPATAALSSIDGDGVSSAIGAVARVGGHNAASVAGEPGSALGDQLEHMEREAIIKALEHTRYNKTAAAKLLGMSFRALRYRVKKLGIE